MEGQESDIRLLVLEMKHQKETTKELVSVVAASNERQEELIKDVHNLVKEFVESNGKITELTKKADDHESRLRVNEEFIISLRPSIERQGKWLG